MDHAPDNGSDRSPAQDTVNSLARVLVRFSIVDDEPGNLDVIVADVVRRT